MQPFVTSQIKNQISEITFGTPKSNSLPGEILEKLAQTILTEGEKPEVKFYQDEPVIAVYAYCNQHGLWCIEA